MRDDAKVLFLGISPILGETYVYILRRQTSGGRGNPEVYIHVHRQTDTSVVLNERIDWR